MSENKIRYQINGANCGRDKDGNFYCYCGKCKQMAEQGNNPSNYICNMLYKKSDYSTEYDKKYLKYTACLLIGVILGKIISCLHKLS